MLSELPPGGLAPESAWGGEGRGRGQRALKAYLLDLIHQRLGPQLLYPALVHAGLVVALHFAFGLAQRRGGRGVFCRGEDATGRPLSSLRHPTTLPPLDPKGATAFLPDPSPSAPRSTRQHLGSVRGSAGEKAPAPSWGSLPRGGRLVPSYGAQKRQPPPPMALQALLLFCLRAGPGASWGGGRWGKVRVCSYGNLPPPRQRPSSLPREEYLIGSISPPPCTWMHLWGGGREGPSFLGNRKRPGHGKKRKWERAAGERKAAGKGGNAERETGVSVLL